MEVDDRSSTNTSTKDYATKNLRIRLNIKLHKTKPPHTKNYTHMVIINQFG